MAGNRSPQICCLLLGVWVAIASVSQADVTVKDLTGSAVTQPGPYVTDVQAAIGAFSQGDFPTALKRLQDAKEATPVLAPAEVMLAQLHFSANQLPQGYAMLEQGLSSAPNDPEPPLLLVERALAENRITEASLLLPQVESLLAGFSENPRRKQNMQNRFYLNGATIDQARQQLDAAQAKLEALVKVDAANAAAHQRLGQLYMAKSEKGDAAADKLAFAEFEQAAKLDPVALPASLMMAVLAKDSETASKWVEFALTNAPNDPRVQTGATNHYMRLGQLDKAKQHAAKMVQLDKDGFESNLLAGMIEQVNGNQAKAIEYLSRAHLLQPANPSVINQLALALLESGGEQNLNRALTFAELNSRMQPGNPDAMATLGWINYRMKNMVAADRAFNQVLATQSFDGKMNFANDTTFILAYLTAIQRRPKEAVQMLRAILENKQLFAYRPQAEKLLAELSKKVGAAGADAPKPQPAAAATP